MGEKLILTIKTVNGDLFAGEFIETRKEYGRDTHILVVDGIAHHVPLMQCSWWAFGKESTIEVRRKVHEEMKEQARKILMEYYKEQVEEEVVPTEDIGIESDVGDLIQSVRQRGNSTISGALSRIARHQRIIAEPEPINDRIIQPGEEDSVPIQRRRSRSSLSRLPDDSPEV